ncbi:POK19 protein, partial [Syrrhaptes paradoxus]|nr:POK19 protein [Syrrhaptes paradoxus]
LTANEIWQTDVCHYAPFGKLKYVHVTVDTFLGYLTASAATGEKARDAKRHWTRCFALMGFPKQIKADNGPSCTSCSVCLFLQQWGVKHIPHSPTDQAIIE